MAVDQSQPHLCSESRADIGKESLLHAGTAEERHERSARLPNDDLFTPKTSVADASNSAAPASTITCPKCGKPTESWGDAKSKMVTCDCGWSKRHEMTKAAQFGLVEQTQKQRKYASRAKRGQNRTVKGL